MSNDYGALVEMFRNKADDDLITVQNAADVVLDAKHILRQSPASLIRRTIVRYTLAILGGIAFFLALFSLYLI